MIVAIAAAVVVYVVMIGLTRAVTMEDMALIPHGEKLGRILHLHALDETPRRPSSGSTRGARAAAERISKRKIAEIHFAGETGNIRQKDTQNRSFAEFPLALWQKI